MLPVRTTTSWARRGCLALTAVLLAGCTGSSDNQLSPAPTLLVDPASPPATTPGRPSGLLEGLRAAVPGVTLPPDLVTKLTELNPDLTDTKGAGAGYDLATIALVATEAARSDAPGRIAAEIRNATRQGNKCISFDGCLLTIEKGGDPDYDGLSGAIELRTDGRPDDIGMTEVTFDAADELRDTRTLNAQTVEPEENIPPPDPLFGPRPDGVLRIGTVLPLLGPDAETNRAILAGIKLAVSEANYSGGVVGDLVELVDDTSGDGSLESSVAAAQRAVDDGADVIITAASTEISQAMIGPVTGAGRVLMSATDGSPTPASIDDHALYIRLAPPESIRAVVTADEVTVDGFTQAYLLAADGPANDVLVFQLVAELEKRGATAIKTTRYDPAATNFVLQATDVFTTGAEATVILGGVDDTARLIVALSEQTRGPRDTPTYGTDLNVRPALAAAIRKL